MDDKEIRRQKKTKDDENKIAKMKQHLCTLGEVKPGWSRRLTLLILLSMCVGCFITVSDLKNFEFPTVNICPDSPTSIERLNNYPELRAKYIQIADYWISQASSNLTKCSPKDGDWRVRTKRTFRPHFLYNRSWLMWKWSDFFVSCEYGGVPCNLDPVSMDIPVGIMSHANNLPLGHEGIANLGIELKGIIRAVSTSLINSLPSMWSNDKPIVQEQNTDPKNWSHGRIILIDHPSNIFVISKKQILSNVLKLILNNIKQLNSRKQEQKITLNNTMVREPGSTKGLHLVLRRPYRRNVTQPGLLTVDSKPSIMQAWDDRLFFSSESSNKKVNDIKNAHQFDGFHIMMHENKKNGFAGDLPADDVFKAGSTRSIISFGLRFGQYVSVSISQYIHQRLSTFFRPCREIIAHHKYLQMSDFFSSGGNRWRYYRLGYTHTNCVAQMRQLVMLKQCNCLSEDYLIPTQMVNALVENGFCHSPSKKYQSGTPEFIERIACHDRIAALPREKIVEMTIPKVYETTILVQLTPELERLWNCPKFCEELVIQPEIIQHQTILNHINVKDNKQQSSDEEITSEDLAIISVYASEASVPIMSEGEQMSIFSLIASIGGAFGLFLGLSGVTLFEIIEALCVIIYTLPAMFRILGRRITSKWIIKQKRREQES
ncbi:unnamed protein product [Heterobilharzia americana]|nr:unnamed protein product [Heterobilharzia americana]